MTPQLLTIPLSHYCERTRWALDHARVAYVETQHLQMFAWFAAWRAGGTRTLPLLRCAGETLTDSRDIVSWANAHGGTPLYPPEIPRGDIEAFEAELAADFGVATRLVCYDWFFRCLDAVIPYNTAASRGYQELALRLTQGMVAPVMKRYLGVSAPNLAATERTVLRTLDAVDRRLADGRSYLFGDGFSAADLTFAALFAPLIGTCSPWPVET